MKSGCISVEQKGEETIARHRSEGIRWPNSRVTRDVYIETLLNPGRRVRRPHPAPLRSEDSSNPSHPLMPLTNERDRKVGDSDHFHPLRSPRRVCTLLLASLQIQKNRERERKEAFEFFLATIWYLPRPLPSDFLFFFFFFCKTSARNIIPPSSVRWIHWRRVEEIVSNLCKVVYVGR